MPSVLMLGRWFAVLGAAAVLAGGAAAVAAAQSGGVCYAGLVVAPGESCTYPGTAQVFRVDGSGRGHFIFIVAGTGISALNTTINGVTYHFKASKQADGTWLIEVAGTATTPTTTTTTTTTPTTTTTTTTTTVPASGRFSDVAADHYAFEAVEWAAQAGVTVGYGDGTFKPQRPLSKPHAVVFMQRYYDEVLAADESPEFTRGDMMVLLKAINDGTIRGAAAPAGTAPSSSGRFSDVGRDHYAFEAVEWAAQAGVTVGYGDGTFKPQRPLSKPHAVVFMQRYYDEVLAADESPEFTRGDMMVLLKAINDGTTRGTTRTDAFKAVTAGGAHSCGLRTDGTVTCWGYNSSGQADAPPGSFKAVSAGGFHSCGLRTDGTVTCWGHNGAGRADAPAGSFEAVSAGGWHSCGLRTDGTVTCWGLNGEGQADAPAGSFKSVSAGGDHSCGLRTDGTVTCWGLNDFGEADAPAGSFKSVSARQQAVGRSRKSGEVVGIGVGGHSCGLRTDGTITCWGSNDFGEADAPAGSFEAVSAGGFHSCGLRTDGTVTCWGSNDFGEADAPAGSFEAVSAGGFHSCGLRTDGTVACWGDNREGQADAPGDAARPPTTADSASPPSLEDCPVIDLGTITSSVTRSGMWGRGDCVLGDETYADVYVFRLGNQSQVVIDLSSDDADSYLILVASDDRLTDDDGGEGRNARLAATLSSGIFRLVANTYEPETGSYRLRISIRDDAAPATGDGDGVVCRVGLRLSPGDRCSYGGFSIRIRDDGAAVLDGNIGGIRMGNTVMDAGSISLNNFRATRSGSTWTIESLP